MVQTARWGYKDHIVKIWQSSLLLNVKNGVCCNMWMETSTKVVITPGLEALAPERESELKMHWINRNTIYSAISSSYFAGRLLITGWCVMIQNHD